MQNVPEITVPDKGQVANNELRDLLRDTENIFMSLANDMNQFISILGNFIKFTEGNVNPIAESAQLNDLGVLLGTNYMNNKTLKLKDSIEKINQLIPQTSAQDAKIVSGFLSGIVVEIDKFIKYLDKVYAEHKNAWERVNFIYKYQYPRVGYADAAPASYHFYNVVLTNNAAVARLERMSNDLPKMALRWKKVAEFKAQGGGSVVQTGGAGPTISFADVSNSDLRELLQKANTNFDTLKSNFNLLITI